MTRSLEGGCLCGAVRYRTDVEPAVVGHCYCVDCRRSSGTSHCTHAMVPDAALTVVGTLKFHAHPADSGNIVSRAFCPECGSPILSRNDGMPGVAFLRASSLDDPGQVRPQMSVYASRAPKWAVPDPGLPTFPMMPEGGPQAVMSAV